MNHLDVVRMMLARHQHTAPESFPDKDVAAFIRTAVDTDNLSRLRKDIERFLNGSGKLTGVEIYSTLEQSSLLILLHLLNRSGSRNRNKNGLQQTYGEHSKLLVYGIDRIRARDSAWFTKRTACRGGASPQEIDNIVNQLSDFYTDSLSATAAWLAGALHDYGKLYERQQGLDAEDGAWLAASILGHVAPCQQFERVVLDTIKFHDELPGIYSGECPTSILDPQYSEDSTDWQRLLVASLGLIQVTGGASLGEGRLTSHRCKMAAECLSGELVADTTPALRLARLLGYESRNGQLQSDNGTASPLQLLDSLPRTERFRMEMLLDRIILHGWWELATATVGADEKSVYRYEMFSRLRQLAALVEAQQGEVRHVCFIPEEDLAQVATTLPKDQIGLQNGRKMSIRLHLLNGTQALLISGAVLQTEQHS